MMFAWNRTRPLTLAWGLAGLVVGAAYATVTVRWNDSLRDPQTILVFAAWLGGLLALFSILAGFASVLLQGLTGIAPRRGTTPAAPPAQLPPVSRYALELCAAGVAWFVFSAGLLVLEAGWLAGSPVLEGVSMVIVLCLGIAAATAARVVEGRLLPVSVLRRLPGAAAVLAGCALAVMMQAAWMRHGGAEAAPVTQQVRELSVNPGRAVLLIGLDGADWRRIDPLMAKGQMPVMKRLIDQGVRSNLHTFEPTLSPIIWNSIATGMREDRHGIHGFTEVWLPGAARSIQGIDNSHLSPRLIAGMGTWLIGHGLLHERPITSRQRRVMAIWNILSDRNLRVGVVNWFASWPSDPVNGYFVSDNNPWRAAFMDRRVGKQIASVQGVTWPPDLLNELAELKMPTVGESVDDILGLDIFTDLTVSERQQLATEQSLLESIRTIYLADVFATAAGLDLMKRERLNLLAVYLSGIDNFSHRLGRLTGVVDRYYRHVDEVLGRYMKLAGKDTTVIIVSDHGWEYQDQLWGHAHAPDGILMMSGKDIPRGATMAQPPSILDIAPTLLALYGLPASKEMEGHPVNAFLDRDVVAAAPAVVVDTYGGYHGGGGGQDGSQQLERNEETLRKLRALGYIR